MQKRSIVFTIPVLLLAMLLAGCSNKKVQNPIANVDSKQPDKVLFDRAMDAMKHNKYDVARMTLQTLINTYPDSEFVARAKLAIGDSWYAEGGTAGLAQAEIEYKDFITFFPNMPEAAEAQLKVANIHYKQMEKPDRDYTHAKRAEEEYKQLLLQFPDSKLVPEARTHLLEVQEVLAEREYRIGRFYYLRQNYPASIARLKSLVDTYPLYSQAEDALYMLGQIYEQEADKVRGINAPEAAKGRMMQDLLKQAQDSYSRIITRYPVTPAADQAKKRLTALHMPVPTPTAEAIAQNKAEEASRRQPGRFESLMSNVHRGPNVSMASKVGDPTLVEPKQTSAPDVTRETNNALINSYRGGKGGTNALEVGTQGSTATPGPNEPVPHSSDNGNSSAQGGTDTTNGTTQPSSTDLTVTQAPPPAPPQVNQAAPPPPTQTNDAANSSSSSSQQASSNQQGSSSDKPASDSNNESSSKKKGKKGIRKIIPF